MAFFIGDPAADLSLENLYSSLDFLTANKDKLFDWMNRRLDKKFGTNRASLVFYDVTNTYFETALTDAERGYEQVDFAERLTDLAEKAVACGNLPVNAFDEAGTLVYENQTPEFLREAEKIRCLRMRGPPRSTGLISPSFPLRSSSTNTTSRWILRSWKRRGNEDNAELH